MFEFCDDKRKCESYHVTLLWILKFSNIFCDINKSIFMQFDCKMFIKYVDEMRKIENDRKIDVKNMYRYKKYKFEFFWFD